MENAMNASTNAITGPIVVAGAGYAGLHVALRLTAKQRKNPAVDLTLVDRHDYHQVITELPRVAGGTRAADAVRIPLQDTLAKRVHFVLTEINGFRPGRPSAAHRGWADRLGPAGTGARQPAQRLRHPRPGRTRPSRCTPLTTPSKYGRRSTKRSRLPRRPKTPSLSVAWRPW